MIERVRIQNFRCLRDVELRLGPLTALVGPNGSGKTAVLEALETTRAVRSGDFGVRGAAVVEVTVADRARPMSCELERGSSLSQAMHRSQELFYHQSQLLRLSPPTLRLPNQAREVSWLESSGSNLTNVFASLPRRVQTAVAARFCELVPTFRDVDVRPSAEGHLQLRFEDRWQADLWYTPEQVSDGSMLALAFLVLPHQSPPPDLLCIDEPENGVHPYLLREVIHLLRELAHGRLGPKPIQVLLATHSPTLLEHLEPEEVRFLRRDPSDGSTVIEEAPTDTADWRVAFDEYQRSLGAMWLSGGLGGVPGV